MYKKLFFLIIFITLLSLFYVYIRTDIVKSAYRLQRKELLFARLVDKNKILSYNINKLESLKRLEEKVVGDHASYEFPIGFQISSIAISASDTGLDVQKANQVKEKGFFAKMLSLRTLAEALEK